MTLENTESNLLIYIRGNRPRQMDSALNLGPDLSAGVGGHWTELYFGRRTGRRDDSRATSLFSQSLYQ